MAVSRVDYGEKSWVPSVSEPGKPCAADSPLFLLVRERSVEIPVTARIMNGFPLRRCKRFFNPIAPGVLSRKVIRWLDGANLLLA